MQRQGRSAGARRAADPGDRERSGAWVVGRAVRVLATGCAEVRRPMPEVGAVVLDPESVVLRLATPDEAPPTGWLSEQDGRTWRVSQQWLAAAPVDHRLPEPFPLLVSVGSISTGRLLLNLAQPDGIIGVGGDAELARSLVRSWSRRLTGSPWAAGTRVIRVGFEPDADFAGLAVSRLAEAGPVLDDPAGGILLFAEPPVGLDLLRVTGLLAEPNRRWSVVVVGAAEATWRLTVGVDGTVDTGLISEAVRLRS